MFVVIALFFLSKQIDKLIIIASPEHVCWPFLDSMIRRVQNAAKPYRESSVHLSDIGSKNNSTGF